MATAPTSKKKIILNEIRQGLKEVKKIKAGSAKAYTMAGLFNGIQ